MGYTFDWSKRGQESDEGKAVYQAALAEFRGETVSPEPVQVIVPECEPVSKAKDLAAKLFGSDTAAIATEQECLDLLEQAYTGGHITHPHLLQEVEDFLIELAVDAEPTLASFEHCPAYIEAETDISFVQASVNAKYDWLAEMGTIEAQRFEKRKVPYRAYVNIRSVRLEYGREAVALVNGYRSEGTLHGDAVAAGGYTLAWIEGETDLLWFKYEDVIEVERPFDAIPIPVKEETVKDIREMNVKELKAEIKALGGTGYSHLRKTALQAMLARLRSDDDEGKVVCPDCREIVPEAEYCDQCGTKLIPDPTPSIVERVRAAAKAAKVEAKKVDIFDGLYRDEKGYYHAGSGHSFCLTHAENGIVQFFNTLKAASAYLRNGWKIEIANAEASVLNA